MDASLKQLIRDNAALRSYLFYTAVLTLKMMLMTLWTVRQRILHNALASEEDAIFLRGTVSRTNENVERVRRGHRNDMESVYLFLLIGFAYLWTDPDPAWANLLFWLFTVVRFIHSFVYCILVMPQPARGLSWGVGYLITGYMAVKTLRYFYL